MSTAIQILGNFYQSVAFVFALNAVGLYVVQEKLSFRSLRFNVALCSAGAIYSFLMGCTQFDPSIEQTRVLQHLVWLSGCLYVYFLISAIEQYLETRARSIRWIRRLILAATSVAGALAIAYLVSKKMYLYSEGALNTQSIFLTDTEKRSLTPNGVTVSLGASVFILHLAAMVIFLKRMIAQTADKILIVTTFLGCVAVLYELCISLFPFKYAISILFLSGMLESFRLAFLSVKNALRNRHQLRQSNFDFQFVTRALGVGIWRWDFFHNRLEWDENNYKVFGVNPERFSGALDAWEKTLHPDDRERATIELQKAIAERRMFSTSFKIKLPSGEPRHIAAKGVLEYDRDGEPYRITGVNWDVTDEKRLEEQVNIERARAIQNSKLASLGEISAGIGHEINNPLMILHGNLGLLEKFRDQPERFRDRIDVIYRSIERISKIVNGLRKFSRSSIPVPIEPKCLSDIVRESVLLTQAKALMHQVSIECQAECDGLIDCNEIEIEQVLVNLINNALDAVASQKERWVKVSVSEQGQEIFLTVEDSGNGISPELRSRLFDPFFTTKPVGMGTGLGLSISKAILDQHGAGIRIVPDKPHTCFEIRFRKSRGEYRHADQSSVSR